MFVMSLRIRKAGLLATLCCAVVVISVLIIAGSRSGDAITVFGWKSAVKCGDNEQRVEYLNSLGWEVESQPLAEMEVLIPEEFDTIYIGYNTIQKEQGFNLEKYRGDTVTKYTYTVTNYPDAKNGVVANLLVYKDKLIGADLCSMELGGFIRALNTPHELLSKDNAGTQMIETDG